MERDAPKSEENPTHHAITQMLVESLKLASVPVIVVQDTESIAKNLKDSDAP